MRSMNSRTAPSFAITSRPPSVVSSCGRSGTSVTWNGRTRSAIDAISAVAAISIFKRVPIALMRISTSRSWMCRRSLRRCTVIPCAPAISAISAAAAGSGSCPFLAWRRVAMWSIFTASRMSASDQASSCLTAAAIEPAIPWISCWSFPSIMIRRSGSVPE